MAYLMRFAAWFNKYLDVAVVLLLPLAAVALIIGFGKAGYDLFRAAVSGSLDSAFDIVLTDVLSMFVVIELMKSLSDYFTEHRLKMTFILDAGIVFVIRELMIGMYRHELDAVSAYALSALLLALGVVRAITVKWSPTHGAVLHP